MCKVMIMAGIKKENVKKAMDFTQVMGDLMSYANDDGLGYAAMDDKGNIFGERWLNNATAWYIECPVLEDEERIDKAFPGMITKSKIEFEYNKFGKLNINNMVAITLHARMATTAKGMTNTHPFVTRDNKISLIHNGVINNHREFDCTLSTCDSEAILVSYKDEKVIDDVNNIQKVADALRGYYACGVLSNVNTPILDIFRANGAQLSVAYIRELETFVFATSDTDIKKACTTLQFTYEKIFTFKDENIVRLNPITGERIDMVTFKAASRYETNYSRSYEGYNSWMGAKEYRLPETNATKGGMSNELINYHKEKSSITKLTDSEVRELIFLKESAG